MAINPKVLFKLKERFNVFKQDHPKIMPFFRTLNEKALVEGTILEIKATTPEGKDYSANIRLNTNDIETIRMLVK